MRTQNLPAEETNETLGRCLQSARPLAIAALAISAVLITVAPAPAINVESDTGVPWEQPVGTLRYWFDVTALPPPAAAGMEADIRWAFSQWRDFDDGFSLSIQEGSSFTSTLTVRWEDMGTGIASLAAGGNPQRCGVGFTCTMRFNSQQQWEVGGGNPGGNEFDARGVALHEVGHSVGLGHSNSSTRYNGVNLGFPENQNLVAMHALSAGVGGRDGIGKDDCAAMQFQRWGDAVCNRTITRTWGGMQRYGVDSTSSTPRYFHGWGFSNAWQYVSANSSGVGVWPNSAHWRMRPYPGTPDGQLGGIYDVEGAGTARGPNQPLDLNSRWRVRAVVGAPNYNTTTARYRICLYMRDDASATVTAAWKANQSCGPVTTMDDGEGWTTVTTPCYQLPSDARDERYLRTYIVVYDEGGGTVFLSQWEVEERTAAQC